MNGEPRSAAGGDVEVTRTGAAKLDAVSVRGTFGDSPGDAGFRFDPLQLPVTVGKILPQGPAAAAGLRVGDQVVTIDDVPLQGLLPDGAVFLLVNHRPGTAVTLGISRGGAKQSIKIPVGKPPM
jgi:S1-C subfamily serine protease